MTDQVKAIAERIKELKRDMRVYSAAGRRSGGSVGGAVCDL